MTKIVVLGGISVPYQQDNQTKKWNFSKVYDWNLGNHYVQEFAKEADLKVRRRSKNHGKIGYPPKIKSLASSLEIHLKPKKNIDFKELVETVQKTNSLVLKSSRAQSKLVLIFLKYKKEHEDSTSTTPIFIENLLVMLLKDKSALMFGNDGEPLGTEIIDFDDVMQAALINIDEFTNSISQKEDIDVSFINGVGGTTDYFIDFFDAEDVIKNKESVSNVLTALNDFLLKKKLKRKQRELCEKNVKSHIERNERNKISTKLQDLSGVIYNTLRIDKSLNIKKGSFEDFVQNNDYKVNEEFSVSKKERETLEFITMDTDVGNLKLKKSLFSKKSKVGNIVFNPQNNELTVKTKIDNPDIIAELIKIQNG
ncbi:nucleoid-associated protein [Shewanella donghaensis]|uniref:nucleoid-associated protein n=1 Tax=Shewanella donghaensis TaxID=238836 RepID=UPI0011843601|nr:nucleoid-associated protein [Shewanella donghaensis]